MSKITKKLLQMGWDSHDTEINKIKKELKELRELKTAVLRLEKLTDSELLDKPKLKVLDQSIFDGLDEKWKFAAVDGCTSRAYVYEQKPHIMHIKRQYWRIDAGLQHIVDDNYDTSNWQNSLIERDTAKELLEREELVGSDSCQVMYGRGDRLIMSAVSNSHQPQGIVTK